MKNMSEHKQYEPYVICT